MIVTCEKIQAAEERLFGSGVIDPEPAMEKAGLGCARAIEQFFPQAGKAIVFVGKGNNGGDALVVARHLREWQWNVELRLASEKEDELSRLAWKKLGEFRSLQAQEWGLVPESCLPESPLVLVDGLLGIGARGPLRGKLGELAAELNALREEFHATSFAVDIPSGIDGDTGEPYGGAVIADVTLSITQVKAGVAADAAVNHVGRIVQIPLPEIVIEAGEADTGTFVLSPENLRPLFSPRSFDTHKGQAGRVAIVAGSPGFTGAARLCSLGALHGGAGLVTLFADESIYEILAASAPPEVMVKPTANFHEVREFPADVIAIGPGIGRQPKDEPLFIELMENDPRPMVIDADALTLLSRRFNPVDSFSPAGPRLLTPHPGELARFYGGKLPTGNTRSGLARDFIGRCPVTLLFKGARTVIADEEEPLALNATGHPGMASGGMGDVLTGLCAAQIAQGRSLFEAGCLGSWVSGRAAEIAVFEDGESAESLSAGQVADRLGRAFGSLKAGEF